MTKDMRGGDTVTLRAKVITRDSARDVRVALKSGVHVLVSEYDIAEHKPRPLAVGDVVWLRDNGSAHIVGVLKAIVDDHGMVKWNDCGTWRALRLDVLVRA